MNMQTEVQKCIAEGAKRIPSFQGTIPPQNPPYFQEGDVFEIPQNFQVMEIRIGDRSSQFILVETQNGIKRFYPSMFSRRVYDENNQCWEHSNGSATELFYNMPTIQDGMDGLRGKKIIVSKIRYITTMNFDYLTKRMVYTFDLV